MIDCAEHPIAQGYTRLERLAGKVSAGGIAAEGALVRRPELWAAMVLQVRSPTPFGPSSGRTAASTCPSSAA